MFPVVNLGQQIRPGLPAQARAGSLGQRWWGHHIANTRAYLEAALAGNVPAALEALKSLWQAVQNWEKITGSWAAGVLMAEHTALAKMLVDGFAEKKGSGWTTAAVDALVKNVESHGQLFPRMPQEFARLFGEHTQLAGAYITDLAEGRLDDFNADFQKALANGQQLAAFTDQNFGPGTPRR